MAKNPERMKNFFHTRDLELGPGETIWARLDYAHQSAVVL
jgi:hypothetical protein